MVSLEHYSKRMLRKVLAETLSFPSPPLNLFLPSHQPLKLHSTQTSITKIHIVARQLVSNFYRRRTFSQQKRRGQWSGKQSPNAPVPDDDTISRYSDPYYIVGSSTPEALAAIAQRFNTSTNELPGGDIPNISIQEMEDTSRAPVELQFDWPPFELDANQNSGKPCDTLAEYMRPRHGWHDYS